MTFLYLDVEDLALLAVELGTPAVRDAGLLDSAAHRPAASVFGEDAYPDLATKAAALLSSIARNHALVDGNKRLAWMAAVALCDLNGHDLRAPDTDTAYDLVIAAATGQAEVAELAPVLAGWIAPFGTD
ncbi:type II toxin-antitoxin system death-on-curing family toxin [Agilicoccus flavus]|uniref:type II toxin-antitoxin system death-on-curing family toxin n=1 Tax=Agilicoccus flavus TaxID=2775968 RepID=UPI001CF6E780|nr:Fic family protein [Agilicoccus flavus]